MSFQVRIDSLGGTVFFQVGLFTSLQTMLYMYTYIAIYIQYIFNIYIYTYIYIYVYRMGKTLVNITVFPTSFGSGRSQGACCLYDF